MNGLRIAIFTSEFFPLRGGIGTYAFEMAQSAASLGAQVTLFAPDYGQDHQASDIERFNFAVRRFPGGRHSMRDAVKKIIFLRSEAARHEFDQILAADWPFYWPLHFSGFKGRKIYMVHGSEIIEICAPLKRFLVGASRLFRARNEFFTNSEFTRRLLLEKFPEVRPECVRAELLGVGEYWSENIVEDVGLVRERFELGREKFLMLTVSRLTPRKGHLEIIKAIKLLPEQLKSSLCYGIVGPAYDSDYLESIKIAIADSGCEVRLLGEVDNDALRALYRASDLFCLVGKEIPGGPVEGFGLVYLEAGAQGVPSIAGSLGGMPEAVISDESGLVVDGSDAAILAAAIGKVMVSEDFRKKLGQGARARALYLTWKRCAAATFGL